MQLKRFRFEYMGDVAVDCYPADPAINSVFRACLEQFVKPFMLAERVGRLSEEQATANLAKAYAQGVVAGSPSPGMTEFSYREWESWLIAHPDEFATLRDQLEPKAEIISLAERMLDGQDVRVAQPEAETDKP